MLQLTNLVVCYVENVINNSYYDIHGFNVNFRCQYILGYRGNIPAVFCAAFAIKGVRSKLGLTLVTHRTLASLK